MSAVDDVDARLCRLEEAYQITQTELLELSTQRVYNPVRGVDEDHCGYSVATLEVTVIAARNMVYHTGLLKGKSTYVRLYMEPTEAARDKERKSTQKRPLSQTPHWHETIVFHGVTMVHATVVLEIIQEERFGSDHVLGCVTIELSSLHDQRPREQWHGLTKDNQPLYGQLYLSCRLNRSRIFALELESELLQNQIKELRDFVRRQRRFSLSFGQDVAHATTAAPQRAYGIRFQEGKEVIHVQRKRERRLSSSSGVTINSSPMSVVRSTGPLIPMMPEPQDDDGGAETSNQPRTKRRKIDPVTDAHIDSLSARLANWLLPPTSSSPTASQPALPPPPPSAPMAPPDARATTRRPPRRPTASKKKKSATASAFEKLERWLFQDPEPTSILSTLPPSPRPHMTTVDLIHAQMRAER